MSVRVNLLPREVEERNVARRQRAGMAVVAALVLALIGVFYWLQIGRVNDAKADLAREEQVRTELQAEVAQLNEFADLEGELVAVNALIQRAMLAEISLAGLLQDVAAVMPADAALATLSASLGAQGTGEEFGTVAANGESLAGHAPGLERLLLSYDKVAGFRDVFFGTSSADLEDPGVVIFSFDFLLGPEVLTGRYLQGLPEELR